MQPLHKIFFAGEPDLVHVRRVIRRAAQLLGYDHRDEVKITAAVSELTRAAAALRGAVEVDLALDQTAACLFIQVASAGIVASANTRGTPVAESVIAAEKLLERVVDRHSTNRLRFRKRLSSRAPELTSDRIDSIRAELDRIAARPADVSQQELVHQSRDLAEALLDIEERKSELATLNAELSDTNRGVVALYAELDERANQLRRAGELKTRFFSHMSHEFRTPLNSILALSNMLLEETDGPLLPEQHRQVSLIRDGVVDLLDLVGDLLDLAKMEAGKTQLNLRPFAVGTLFGALRAMIRPLLRTAAVALEFGSATDLPPLVNDEAKITQILRNFLSNAVKFTEQGSITVSARLVSAREHVAGNALTRDSVLFVVADTGVGVAPEHQGAIFEEFQQVENRLQRKSRGTGLGLPLCRRLAGLLGGRVWVESELGRGARFYLLVPVVHASAPAEDAPAAEVRPTLLIVDERVERRAAVHAAFRESLFLPVEASAADLTAAGLAALQPAAALLDPATASTATVEALRAAAIPIVALSGQGAPTGNEQLVADTYRAALRTRLRNVLVLDDDEAYRTILTKQLGQFCERVRATHDAQAMLDAARTGQADCVLLDLIMPDVDGFTLLQQLRGDAGTSSLPIVICSSKVLTADEHVLVRRLRASFLPKDALGAARIAKALLDARHLAPGATSVAGVPPDDEQTAADPHHRRPRAGPLRHGTHPASRGFSHARGGQRRRGPRTGGARAAGPGSARHSPAGHRRLRGLPAASRQRQSAFVGHHPDVRDVRRRGV
jgi:signal transduction histidine kinase/ActR/RegA family two-component response regulator